MKKTFKMVLSVIMIIALLSTTAFAASTTGSTADETKYPKQVMLVPTAYEGSYDMFVYANVQIDSPYVQKGYRWVRIRGNMEMTPADKEADFTFSYSATEYLVNYFLDDYYFLFENAGMSEFQPYNLIEKKTNKIVANPGLKFVGDYQFPASELKDHFGIELQDLRIGKVIFLTLDKKYVFDAGEK